NRDCTFKFGVAQIGVILEQGIGVSAHLVYHGMGATAYDVYRKVALDLQLKVEQTGIRITCIASPRIARNLPEDRLLSTCQRTKHLRAGAAPFAVQHLQHRKLSAFGNLLNNFLRIALWQE